MRQRTSGVGVILALALGGGVVAEPSWQPVPLRTAAARDAGIAGGEGAQWPQALAVAGDGRFLLFGTDVGGIYRSLDGGDQWEPCNVGYHPRGNCGFAIDPHNPDRCLAVGSNSLGHEFHGIYLSVDRAASWKQVQPARICGVRDYRRELAYDPGSHDPAAGITRVAYWSRTARDKRHRTEIHPALYRSTDGGASWEELPDSAELGGGEVAVHPRTGVVMVAGPGGFRRWNPRDGRRERTIAAACDSLSVVPARPDRVLVACGDALRVSRDGGRSFGVVRGSGLPPGKPLRQITASPADPDRLLVWVELRDYDWPRFVSYDEGRSWSRVELDTSDSFLPNNARQAQFVWHPTDPEIAWSFGGDWLSRSTDGGRNFRWQSSGYSGILVGDSFNFCQRDPDVLFVGSQDYNGAVTCDGGDSWRYTNVSGHAWGGFTYGAYAASRDLLVVGNTDRWHGHRKLAISRDGGRTWDRSGQSLDGPAVAMGDPLRPGVVFASNLRSGDGGRSWSAMDGCTAVFTASAAGERTLVGVNGDRSIVGSTDGGVTWKKVAEAPGRVEDVAIDHERKRVYAVSDHRLAVWNRKTWRIFEGLPEDQKGRPRVSSVAVDPVHPEIVYAVSKRNLFASNAAVIRSRDAGQSWEVLTRREPLRPGVRDGGREGLWVRVHPVSREAWVIGGCYGIWKIGAPE